MLQVEKLVKNFDGFQAVADANLQVDQGQIAAVIGPNGAGKSTLFNLITGHLTASSGQITFKGQPITNLPPHQICRLGVSRSFQLINIFNRLTVFENIQAAVLAERGKSGMMFGFAAKMVVEETRQIIKQFGLTRFADTVCSNLSYGDQKVLEIAISFACRPELLLLDEPTAGMSPEETQKIVELVKTLSREHGVTILITEHDVDLVFDLAQKIMVLHQGRTLAQGLPEEIRQNKQVQEAYLGELNHARA
jgi:branched-chain amino acid transport system ATP-binding protein